MKKLFLAISSIMAISPLASAASLTVYENFALVNEHIALQVTQGKNELDYHEITRQLDPSSVMLTARDPSWRVIAGEQNYFNSPLSVSSMLEKYEGKTINFEVKRSDHTSIIEGKVLRAQPSYSSVNNYQQQPIIEVDGEVRFGLPGTPLFPALESGSVLKPTLNWELYSNKSGLYHADLSYLTSGFSWSSDYNILLNPKSGQMDLSGWITLRNDSGKDFDNINVKFIAGDVNKVGPKSGFRRDSQFAGMAFSKVEEAEVTQKAFDEYHLYTAPHPISLKTSQQKQVQFLSANNSSYNTEYLYDGASLPHYYSPSSIWQDKSFGTQSNQKVSVYKTFENTERNNLGKPFPKGRVRFYQKDDDGTVVFVGENTIDHTPKGEDIRILTGQAFDVVGERKQLYFEVNSFRKTATETIEVELTNRKEEDVQVNVVEHLYRGPKYHIDRTSARWKKIDSTTMETKVTVPANSVKAVKYTVQYQW